MTRMHAAMAAIVTAGTVGGIAISGGPNAHTVQIRVATDSLRAETRRQGTSGTLAPRATVVRRLADRIDSLEALLPTTDTVPVVIVDTVPSPLPFPPVDTTTPLPGQPRGIAELPRLVPSWPAGLATAACTDTVRTAPQAAFNAARAGDVLCVDGSHSGNFTLPARADSGWVVVRSLAPCPAQPGQRIRPTTAGALATLSTPNVQPTLATTGAARGWYLACLHVTTAPQTAIVYTVVDLRPGSRDVVLDRMWIEPPATQGVQRCVALNGGATSIVDSWLDECHAKGFDSQAVWGYTGAGPYLIENNTLAGAGENVMFGGADPKIAGLVPCDVTLRRNHIVTPISWRGTWTKKNLFETKNVCRLLIERNVLEGSWPDGQTGTAFVLKTANQGGGCPWCSVHDVTITENRIVRAARAIEFLGKSNRTMVLDSVTRRLHVADNFFDSLAVGETNPGTFPVVTVMNRATDVHLVGNTFTSPLTLKQALGFDGAGYISAERLVVTGNAWSRTSYPLFGCGGEGAIVLGCLVDFTASGNELRQPVRPVAYPPGFTFTLAGTAGVSRATIDAAVAGVVVPR